jgi:hypothetical protein
MLKMFGLKKWINDYNHDICGMMSYTVSDKKIVTDNICVQLVPYSTHNYPYLYSRSFIFVFVSEAICIRIRITYKNKYGFSDIRPYSIRLHPYLWGR